MARRRYLDGGKDDDYIYDANTGKAMGELKGVTVTAEAPTVYWDGFNWIGYDSNGRRHTKSANFNPEGAHIVNNPKQFENFRLAQAKKADVNHTHEFADQVRGLAELLVTAPADEVLAEPIGAGLGYVGKAISKTKLGRVGNRILNNTTRELYNMLPNRVKSSINKLSKIVEADANPIFDSRYFYNRLSNNNKINSKVNWDADNWFKNISGRPSYTEEEAQELASFVPEYRDIENKLFSEGKLIEDANGNIVVKDSKMTPQEYIMRQSSNFKNKLDEGHHYTGVSKQIRDKFENRDKYSDDVWTDTKSPANVEEYAYKPSGGSIVDKDIEDIKHSLFIRSDRYDLHKSKLDYKLQKGLITKEQYNDELAKLTTNYEELQTLDNKELESLLRIKQNNPLRGGRVYDITYPKDAKAASSIDAKGAHWQRIPYGDRTTSTDHIVSTNKLLGYDVTKIDNVMDTYNGTLLNEEIIHSGVPIKSVLGNTGAFDISGPNKYNIYRAIVPLVLGEEGIRRSLKSGGTIHIKPENRGKFNALKERTGKTTEELTHSKNPLTRKRAIFAQNDAKWKH